jgi:hypothetical protein
MNRRDCLRGAGLALMAPAVAGAVQGRASPGAVAVIVDARFPQSVRYAEVLGVDADWRWQRGDDLMAFWQQTLLPRLSAGAGLRPQRLAGLTTGADHLVLRDWARELGYRPLSLQWHDARRVTLPGDRRVQLAAWSFGAA